MTCHSARAMRQHTRSPEVQIGSAAPSRGVAELGGGIAGVGKSGDGTNGRYGGELIEANQSMSTASPGWFDDSWDEGSTKALVSPNLDGGPSDMSSLLACLLWATAG
eukprot:scaffold182362_cov26-Tisochrysis_lutea.AAC.3